MNMFRHIVFLTLFFFAACLKVKADSNDSLTLEQLIQEALEKNPEISILKADVAASEGEVMTASTRFNPVLSASPARRQVRGEGSEFRGNLGLSQTFEFPGKRSLRRAVAEKNVEIKRLALEGFRHQLTTQVRHVFYSSLISHEILNLKVRRFQLAQSFANAAHKKVSDGFAPEFEAIKADVEVVSAQRALRDAEAQDKINFAVLNALLGRAPDLPLQIVGELVGGPSNLSPAELRGQALSRNPSLRVQVAAVERSRLNLRSVQKSRLPDFTLGPNMEYSRNEQTIGLSMSLPLPLWDKKKGAVVAATAEYAKAQAESARLQQEILRDVVSASHNLASAQEILGNFTPEFRARLETELNAASQSYAEGRTSLLIYLETQRTYFDTQADYFEILQQIYDAQAKLESALGVPLAGQSNQIDPQEK